MALSESFDTNQQLWTSALEQLRNRLSLENFETWLAPVECTAIERESITLRIPNRFFQDWISAHYLELILEALGNELPSGVSKPTQVRWEIDEELKERTQATRMASSPAPAPSKPPPTPEPTTYNLKPKYSFNRFIVGPSNQLAYAASVAAASAPGHRYNPLFLYGGVGLGKTHLMNAMGQEVLLANPAARVLYLSAERFTNEFIWALQNHRINEFRERYRRNCDVLLMDDIQFLAGREQTQEEFFHTFNALYHQDKQIAVTSDVYPQQIPEMQERLVSRFHSGMVADIQSPELDTRIAILKKKAEAEEIDLPSDVATFIAQTVKVNVRELEGTLLRIAVKAELLSRPIDLELAQSTLQPLNRTPERAMSVDEVQQAVCGYFGLKVSDLRSKRRSRNVSFPRMVAMYLCRERLGASYPCLGESFGKDHTTVINAVRKIGSQLEERDERVVEVVDAIERKLGL